MKKFLSITLLVVASCLSLTSFGQQSICPGTTVSITVQGDFTATGAVDTTSHVYKTAQTMPVISYLDTVTHTAKTSDSLNLKVSSEVWQCGFQIDAQHLTHNGSGADSTTITLYGSKSGGNWQYPTGGWVSLQSWTMANNTNLQSFNYDINSGGIGGNAFTQYMIVTKVGELYAGTNAKVKGFFFWR